MIALLALLLATSPSQLSLELRPDAGTPELARAPLPFSWELPLKTVAEVPIDGTTWVDGIPVKLRELIVEGKAEDIGQFYLRSFERQGLYVAPGQAIDKLFSAVDPESIITYSVVLHRSKGGRTTVVLGEAHPLERQRAAADGLPLMPNAKGGLPVQMEGYLQLGFAVTASAADVTTFYARELGQRGWTASGENLWERAGERVELEQQPHGTQQLVTLRRFAPPRE